MNYESTTSFMRREDGTPIYAGDDTKFKPVRKGVIDLIKNADHGNYFTSKGNNLKTVNAIAELAITIDTGNCMELAFVTASKLKAAGASNIDIVTIGPDSPLHQHAVDASVLPHWFVAIGRERSKGGSDRRILTGLTTREDSENDMKSKIGMPDTWGDNVAIVDAWDRNVYPATSYSEFWDGINLAARDGNRTRYAIRLACRLMFRI